MYKRIFAITLALIFMAISSIAFAITITIEQEEEIDIQIKPIDIYTGEFLDSKTYVKDTQFALCVQIKVPKNLDIRNCTLKIAKKGIYLNDTGSIALRTGEYPIYGIVTDTPAYFQIQIEDKTLDSAVTVDELVEAAKQKRQDKIVTYTFNSPVQTNTSTANTTISDNNGIVLPKTGDASVLIPALCVAALAACFVIGGKDE